MASGQSRRSTPGDSDPTGRQREVATAPTTAVTDPFVVAVKASARRTNGAVGRAVNRDGPRHEFPDREAAERWARRFAREGDRPVWVRRANPDDTDPVDAYLVGRRPRHGQTDGRSPRGGEQATLGDETGGDSGEGSAEGEI